jgi:DUF1680 family protein
VTVRLLAGADCQADWPHADVASDLGRPREVDVALIPYHDWANRGPSTMRVWLPT